MVKKWCGLVNDLGRGVLKRGSSALGFLLGLGRRRVLKPRSSDNSCQGSIELCLGEVK